jgi:hypothetical protein
MRRLLLPRTSTPVASTRLDDTLAKLQMIRSGRRPPMVQPHGARLGEPTPTPPLAPQPVRIQLPTGRWVRGHIAPAAAHRNDLAVLKHIVALDTARSYAAIRHNAHAIDALASTQQALASRVAELQRCCDGEMLKRLLERLKRLDLRVGKAVRAQRQQLVTLSQRQRSMRGQMRAQASRASVQVLNSTATSVQAAAFGTKGSLLARNNLLIAGNGLLWSFFGDLLQLLGLGRAGGWLSPVASLLGSQVALGGEQHERFVSGVATQFFLFKGNIAGRSISLEDRIGSRVWPSFRRRTDVPVTVKSLDPIGASIDASVADGVLTIVLRSSDEFPDGAEIVNARIAWLVDTGDPNG